MSSKIEVIQEGSLAGQDYSEVSLMLKLTGAKGFGQELTAEEWQELHLVLVRMLPVTREGKVMAWALPLIQRHAGLAYLAEFAKNAARWAKENQSA